MGYAKEHMSLMAMGTLRGQGNDDLRELWSKNCEIVIIPLDVSIKQTAKAYVSENYYVWVAN